MASSSLQKPWRTGKPSRRMYFLSVEAVSASEFRGGGAGDHGLDPPLGEQV